MNIIEKAAELSNSQTNNEDAAKIAFAAKVQAELIEPLCRKFDISFVAHPRYDEATFVSKEGVWYRPSWGGASDTMANASEKEMNDAITACWKVLVAHHLISSTSARVQSFENGLDTALKSKIIDRLCYMACCP